jgi:putative membrane protein
MKKLAYVLGLAGLAALIALVARAGLQSVLQALTAAGWPLLWLVPLHLVPLALDAAGWRVLLAPRDADRRARWPVLLAVATVREAVNRLLPVAGVGGELVGIRILSKRGLPVTPVAASVVTEVVLTLTSLVLFAALGLALLVAWTHGGASVDQILIGILIALPVPVAGLWLIGEGRLVSWIERFATLVSGGGERPAWLASMPVFEAELSALARRRGRLVLTTALQLSGMIVGAAEVWLALRLLGHPVGVVPALIIESVVMFVRNLAFAVPAGLGAQEAGIVVVCAALGLDQQVAIGLALAKRMRELLFGLPALLGWNLWEGGVGVGARTRAHAGRQDGRP